MGRPVDATPPSCPPSSSNGGTPHRTPRARGWEAAGATILQWCTRLVGLGLLTMEARGGHDPLTMVIAGAMVGVGEVAVESWRGRR